MKFTITVETEEEDELKCFVDAVANHNKLMHIYDFVFRNEIKYGLEEERIKAFEIVWAKLSNHLNDGDTY